MSDGASGRVVVVDLERGEAIASLSTEGAARIHSSSDGMRGFAVQSSADAVQGIVPGLSYENHGDHVHAETAPPSVLSELVVSCSRPLHFVPRGGHAATFCDGDGMLHVFDDTGSGEAFDVDTFDSGRAHHGVGLVAFDHVLLSTPNPEDEEDVLPIGVRALDFDGMEVASFDECPGLHGEAATHEHVCFGCSDGVMCLESNDTGELSSVKLTHPGGTDDGVRVGTLAAAEHEGVLVGNWRGGARAVTAACLHEAVARGALRRGKGSGPGQLGARRRRTVRRNGPWGAGRASRGPEIAGSAPFPAPQPRRGGAARVAKWRISLDQGGSGANVRAHIPA